jgi:hypothetical protein
MKVLHWTFNVGFIIITVLIVACALLLIGFSVLELWHALVPEDEISSRMRFSAVLETIGLLTIAVATLELGQTVLEEEVQRHTQVSLPTRVRRFLSRFMIVVIVSLSIEFLVAIFRLLHQENIALSNVALVGFATAALLVSWGAFVWLNRSAEELEPEAIEQVKREDEILEGMSEAGKPSS